MKVVISRTYTPFFTQGQLIVFDGMLMPYRCMTLELPDLGNQRNVSCIPEGEYDCEKIIRPSGKKAFWIKDVPGRDSILIHSGNYAKSLNPRTKQPDTEGCILPGGYFTDIDQDGFTDIADSGRAMSSLLSFLPDKFKIYII